MNHKYFHYIFFENKKKIACTERNKIDFGASTRIIIEIINIRRFFSKNRKMQKERLS